MKTKSYDLNNVKLRPLPQRSSTRIKHNLLSHKSHPKPDACVVDMTKKYSTMFNINFVIFDKYCANFV